MAEEEIALLRARLEAIEPRHEVKELRSVVAQYQRELKESNTLLLKQRLPPRPHTNSTEKQLNDQIVVGCESAHVTAMMDPCRECGGGDDEGLILLCDVCDGVVSVLHKSHGSLSFLFMSGSGSSFP